MASWLQSRQPSAPQAHYSLYGAATAFVELPELEETDVFTIEESAF